MTSLESAGLFSPTGMVALLAISDPEKVFKLLDRINRVLEGDPCCQYRRVLPAKDCGQTATEMLADYNQLFGEDSCCCRKDMKPYLPSWAQDISLQGTTLLGDGGSGDELEGGVKLTTWQRLLLLITGRDLSEILIDEQFSLSQETSGKLPCSVDYSNSAPVFSEDISKEATVYSLLFHDVPLLRFAAPTSPGARLHTLVSHVELTTASPLQAKTIVDLTSCATLAPEDLEEKDDYFAGIKSE
ncbi:hypothetical protein GQX73_g8747 [Xylaria multiplex]|uniref:Uncharacterized protein n=1 Tax=Xylaria multiplex TaxID=323545 RepID=A0A7C8IMI9_9PEZI|nr:hypothetical protein GQX73_g8747 [Xylaria multiplex]